MDSNQLNITLKLTVLLELTKGKTNMIEVGNALVELGTDKLALAGFWIMSLEKDEMFYSPNFRKNLGYENEIDFPSVLLSYEQAMLPDSLHKSKIILNDMIDNKSKSLYKNLVRYKMKNGQEKDVLCLGKFIYDKNDKAIILCGSHHLIY